MTPVYTGVPFPSGYGGRRRKKMKTIMVVLVAVMIVISACASQQIPKETGEAAYAKYANELAREIMRVKFTGVFLVERKDNFVRTWVRIEDFKNGDRWEELREKRHADNHTVFKFKVNGVDSFVQEFKIPDNEDAPIVVIAKDSKSLFEMGVAVECHDFSDSGIGPGTVYRVSFLANCS